MDSLLNVSFEELGERELLKGGVWWLGMIAAVSAAAYLYAQTAEG